MPTESAANQTNILNIAYGALSKRAGQLQEAGTGNADQARVQAAFDKHKPEFDSLFMQTIGQTRRRLGSLRNRRWDEDLDDELFSADFDTEWKTLGPQWDKLFHKIAESAGETADAKEADGQPAATAAAATNRKERYAASAARFAVEIKKIFKDHAKWQRDFTNMRVLGDLGFNFISPPILGKNDNDTFMRTENGGFHNSNIQWSSLDENKRFMKAVDEAIKDEMRKPDSPHRQLMLRTGDAIDRHDDVFDRHFGTMLSNSSWADLGSGANSARLHNSITNDKDYEPIVQETRDIRSSEGRAAARRAMEENIRRRMVTNYGFTPERANEILQALQSDHREERLERRNTEVDFREVQFDAHARLQQSLPMLRPPAALAV